jgi:transposase
MLESEQEQTKRRRSANYPLEFKRHLAQQACDESVSVAQLEMPHGLNTNMEADSSAKVGNFLEIA